MRFDRWGLLVVNLGTPDSTDVGDVRRYLREFLSDPRVIDMNPIGRWLLLNLIILPRRPKESAHAYRQIWTERGSPLLFHGEDLVELLRQQFMDTPIELAMRYQNPSIARGMKALQDAGVDRVVILPLFPHQSSAAWGSAVERCFQIAAKLWDVPALHVVPPFFDHPGFIDSFAAIAKRHLSDFDADLVMMSYHGLPERHVTRGEVGGSACLQTPGCCDALTATNRNCYRAQCYQTSRLLADAIGLKEDQWEVAFQSRLGRDPWIKPYTDHRLIDLAGAGIRRLAVMSPAFVADCLETIEELGIRAKEDFVAAGGEDLLLIPSLNAEPVWVSALTELLASETPLHAD